MVYCVTYKSLKLPMKKLLCKRVSTNPGFVVAHGDAVAHAYEDHNDKVGESHMKDVNTLEALDVFVGSHHKFSIQIIALREACEKL
jgi:hypothetical protein